jgi:hypothetical protein
MFGATKVASENMATAYGEVLGPIAINRCGVLAGGGQLGTVE